MRILTLLLFFSFLSVTGQEKKQPNIVLIMAEDISTDLACYGMKAVKTPILDALAAEGIQFNNCFGNNSICSPSRSNMITGVHQNRINAHHHRSNRKIPLDKNIKPITALLRDKGYTNLLGHSKVRGKGRKTDVNFKSKPKGKWNGKDQFGLFDLAANFDKKHEPFFSQVSLYVSHRGDHWANTRKQSKHPVQAKDIELPPYMADHPVIRNDWALYLDQIEKMDQEVGLLIDDLKQKGLYDNTIIIFIGDNGRCNIRGKGYLYDPGLRIPLIVHHPKTMKANKSDRLVSSTDIAATILDIAGVEKPDYMKAKSVFESEERSFVYSARDLWDEILERSRAISTKKYRYIHNYMPEQSHDAHQAYLEFHRPAVHIMRKLYKKGKLSPLQSKFFAPQKEVEELYDLENDPFETKNLVNDPKHQMVLEDMRNKEKQWQKENRDFGLEPIDWKNAPPPKAGNILKWVKKNKPKVYEAMLNGVEPGFSKLSKEFKKFQKEKKKKDA